jgi:hypothetical protein
MQVLQNKWLLQNEHSPTHRKERDGWGTQFHAPWVGDAGGGLTRNQRGRGRPRYSRPGGRRYGVESLRAGNTGERLMRIVG